MVTPKMECLSALTVKRMLMSKVKMSNLKRIKEIKDRLKEIKQDDRRESDYQDQLDYI